LVQTLPGGPASLYDTVVTVSFIVRNSGGYNGAEVSQLYLGFPASAGEPPKVLRGFEKTSLRKGQSKAVSVSLRRKDVSIW
jgi:beta-glucosidase